MMPNPASPRDKTDVMTFKKKIVARDIKNKFEIQMTI